MDEHKFQTIEMTRQIRDKNYKRLLGKSQAERILYYQELAHQMEKKVPALLKTIKDQSAQSVTDH